MALTIQSCFFVDALIPKAIQKYKFLKICDFNAVCQFSCWSRRNTPLLGRESRDPGFLGFWSTCRPRRVKFCIQTFVDNFYKVEVVRLNNSNSQFLPRCQNNFWQVTYSCMLLLGLHNPEVIKFLDAHCQKSWASLQVKFSGKSKSYALKEICDFLNLISETLFLIWEGHDNEHLSDTLCSCLSQKAVLQLS